MMDTYISNSSNWINADSKLETFTYTRESIWAILAHDGHIHFKISNWIKADSSWRQSLLQESSYLQSIIDSVRKIASGEPIPPFALC